MADTKQEDLTPEEAEAKAVENSLASLNDYNPSDLDPEDRVVEYGTERRSVVASEVVQEEEQSAQDTEKRSASERLPHVTRQAEQQKAQSKDTSK
jgi:uncharacterized membrane protein